MKKFQPRDKFILAILTFLGIGGLLGGLSFTLQPDGSWLGMKVHILNHSFVSDYFWPGVFLLLFMGIWPIINIYGLIASKSWVRSSLCLLGLTTMVWIVYESVIIRTFSPLQPTIFIVGVVLFLGGLPKREITK